MSQRAFIILLDIDDSVDPQVVAQELSSDLDGEFDVISVHPWASPGQSLGTTPLAPTVAPLSPQ